jgi:hypothetical protein
MSTRDAGEPLEGGGPSTSQGSQEELADEVDRLRRERDELSAKLMRGERRQERRRKYRQFAVGALVVLACLLATLTAPAGWTYRTLLTTDVFIARVTPIGYDPAVTPVLSDRLTNQIFGLIDVEEVVAGALPERGQILAGPLTGAIRDFVNERVNEVLASDRFRTTWVAANRFAHQQIVSILRDEGDVVSTSGGTVTLNLLPVINEALRRIESRASGLFQRDVELPEISSGEVPAEARARISAALGVELPADFGEVEVFESDGLEAAQDAVRFFDRTILIIVVALVLALAGALWLSRNRRRTLLQIVVGTLVGLVVVRRLAMWFEDEIVDLAARPDGRRALSAISDQILGSFFSVTATAIIIGIAIVVLALISGPYSWAVGARARAGALGRIALEAKPTSARQEATVSWIRSHREALQLGGALFGVLVLLIVDLAWIPFLVLAAVLVLYQVALMRIGSHRGSETT